MTELPHATWATVAALALSGVFALVAWAHARKNKAVDEYHEAIRAHNEALAGGDPDRIAAAARRVRRAQQRLP